MTGGPCLLTGATGFIGGHVAQRLVRDGRHVRCLVRPTSDAALLRELGVELAVGDLMDAASVARAAQGCDAVVHGAALVSDWATVAEIRQVNVQGTRNVLDAAAGASVRRLVHISSTDVYGHPGGRAVDETHVATRFANWYAETKALAEREVRATAQARGLEAVILRPATVYGPRSTDVIGEIAKAIRGRHMVLIDGGRTIAGLVYAGNVADAALLALDHEAAPGEAYNITDALPVTWRGLTDDLAAGLGCPPVRLSMPYDVAGAIGTGLEHGYRLLRRATGLRTAPLLSRQAVQVMGVDQDFSNARAREGLGWTPRVGYAAGLEATLDWLRALPGG
ncbi:NAD-dependent epimerase/dehydratase family protein [Baekduia soli]|uniref:NAD-dependent epimerase/dehydratase family protein n=1 Tax=Baekduia soli TaxID=496014 RepID=UPI001651E97A|nr:NAD-dependent epimerase/dehydratase family protein [Baekduia soli]